ncbi:hypothetical protein H6F89_26875 [Cyanobacteria bacterium FACHB-63]|nr:hypothetical protein [Cyanobacteria bacterium FACHB-63]
MKLVTFAAASLSALTLCSWFGTIVRPPSAIANQSQFSAVQKETATDSSVSCGSGRISRPCPF